MGLLDHLWDDTVAGPRPDNGPSELRKYSSFSSSPTPHSPSPSATAPGGFPVTRSITIGRSSSSIPPTISVDSDSLPSSPASGGPDSPLTPRTPRGDWRRFRKKPAAEGMETAEPRSPTVYDWVVISSLDR